MKNILKILNVVLIIGLVITNVYTYNKLNKFEQVVINDTIYNTIVLDSIDYLITKRDSIIYEIKTKLKYEIEENINSSDSAVVSKFYELVLSE